MFDIDPVYGICLGLLVFGVVGHAGLILVAFFRSHYFDDPFSNNSKTSDFYLTNSLLTVIYLLCLIFLLHEY